MTEDYSEMSEAELVELQRGIEKELAERRHASKPEKLPSQKPRVEKSKQNIPPFEWMSPKFCRKCGHPIWQYTTGLSIFPSSGSRAEFYIKGREGKAGQVTHCPNCKRKLSPGRLRFSDAIHKVIHDGTEHSTRPPKEDGMMLYKYCVECGYKMGFLMNSDPPQFFDEADRQKPVTACPSCNTPLSEADDVDFNDQQRATLSSIYQKIFQWATEREANEKELAQLLEKIRSKKPASLEGVKAIIGVHTNSSGRDKISLKEQLAKCQNYCETNGLEVIEKLRYSYESSDKKLQLDKLIERKVGAIVASMNWLTSNSHREGVKFVRELEQAGIHLEIIVTEDENQ